MQVKKQQLELDMGQQIHSKSGNEYIKTILSPCLFNWHAEYHMWNAGQDELNLELRLLGEISITSDMQMLPPLWQKAKKRQRASWWKWKEESEKAGLKLSIQEMKIRASGPITSRQIDGKQWTQWEGSKIPADGDAAMR